MTSRPEPATDRSATYRQVFASREFSFMYVARTISLLGDQALRVALTLLIYHDTHSPLLTAVAYALTFLPWVIGGPLLAGWADRLPRRTVLTFGNLLRASIVAVMTIPHLPVPALLALVCVAEVVAPPVEAARDAVGPEILTGDRFVVGLSLNQAVNQASQIIGFGLGGILVEAIGARGALGLDALSFAVAAVLIRVGLRRPYLALRTDEPRTFWADTREGFRITLGRPGPRRLLLLAWSGAAFLIVPEALAAPFVAKVAHGGDSATGWLLAAQPAGMFLGFVLLGRLVRPSQRQRTIRPLALVSVLPLIAFIWRPSLVPALLLLAVSGAAWSYQLPLQSAFVSAIPPEARGRAFGVANAGLQVSNGIGVLAGGGLAELFGVTPAITVAGVAGFAAMLALTSLRAPAEVRPAATQVEEAPATT
jgi:predicted MFS family arabinose efflux permease